ncbi:RCC1 domain-containing protein [Salinispora arenicola]|uniref:RCC1 domain-containing protein n=2 Tax=Salinispora arenicola TaxID=168697 RepID=UPI000373BD6E|nr:Ig-like domain repeat protein [Salinispora arenicola]
MRRLCRWAGRGAGAGRVGRAIAGWWLLVLAMTVMQAVTVSPAAAQQEASPSTAASDTILAWGQNDYGELGNGSTAGSNTPVVVNLPSATTVTAVAGGGDHSLALTSAGTVLAWGRNDHGQLGDGSTVDKVEPVSVDFPAGTTVTAIAGGDDHNLALTSAGTVLAWGRNHRGQLGDGSTVDKLEPVSVDFPAGTTVTAIAGGDDHNLAITSTGGVFTWGSNSSGELGDGTTIDRTTPILVGLPGTTVTTTAGGGHSFAVTSADTVHAWGDNSDGQLGNGNNVDQLEPVAVSMPLGATVTAIAGGDDHSLALTAAGALLAWGNNDVGQLGNGNTLDQSEPVDVNLPTGTTITAIATRDSDHSLALTAAGTVLAWGENDDGELGDGSTLDRSEPVDVNLPTGTTVTAIAAGDGHSLALVAPTPTSTTTLQVTPANPTADQDITLTATVTCNVDTPTGTITFRTNGETLATMPLTTSATATHTTTLPTGTHTLTAHHTSTNTCPNSQSPPTTITINPDLPITGPTLTTTTGAATLSILAGTILIYAARRRRPHHHQPE